MTALYLLGEFGIQAGEKVLIYGASGSVGTYAVQLARHFGAVVTGVCSSRHVELVRSLGAEKVIDYTVQDFTEGTEVYEVIFDAVGKMSPAQSKRVLKPGGRYASIRSSTHEDLHALEFLKGLIEAGEMSAVVDRSYPLEQIAEAYEYVSAGHKQGNVVVTVSQEVE